MNNPETTINEIRYKGIQILLPTPITVNLDEINNLYKIDKYATILYLFGESLSKMANGKNAANVKESEENEQSRNNN